MAGVQVVGFTEWRMMVDRKTERKRRGLRGHDPDFILHKMLFMSKGHLGHALGTNSPGTTPAMVNGRRRVAEARKYRMVASFFFCFFFVLGENGDI